MSSRAPASTQREDLAGFLRDLESLETLFATWDEEPRSAIEAYRRAIEALHGEALRRLIRALKSDPAALAAMKAAAGDEVIYAVLRHHGLLKPSLDERVEAALESVRPALATHGGDVRLVRLLPPVAEVQLTGACDGCASSAMTFHSGIRAAVQDACPEITEVVMVKSQVTSGVQSVTFVSPFAT